MRITVSKCPLREGGGPKGRGWIRLEEAESAQKTERAFAAQPPGLNSLYSILKSIFFAAGGPAFLTASR
jgi:hypothetical protein